MPGKKPNLFFGDEAEQPKKTEQRDKPRIDLETGKVHVSRKPDEKVKEIEKKIEPREAVRKDVSEVKPAAIQKPVDMAAIKKAVEAKLQNNKPGRELQPEVKKKVLRSKAPETSDVLPLSEVKVEAEKIPPGDKNEVKEEKLVQAPPKVDVKEEGAFDMSAIKKAIEGKLQEKKSNVKSMEKQSIHGQRLHTGIPGLDEVMEGGLRTSTVTLVGGGAGCGKSIFCMQFLVEGIEQHGETGVYISFEESQEKIVEDFSRFNWNLQKKIDDGKLIILYYTPEQVHKVLEAGGGTVRDAIESIGAKRLVIDSLTAFTLLHESELAQRREVLRLIDAVKKWKVTTLMTSEQEPDPEHHQSTIMEFEVDGVILLYNVKKGDIRERSLEIFKMRATKHSAKIFPMKIDEEGITMYPEETVF